MSNPTAPAMTICLPDTLPPEQQVLSGIRRAPDRGFRLTRCLMPVLPRCLKTVWMPRTDLSIPPILKISWGRFPITGMAPSAGYAFPASPKIWIKPMQRPCRALIRTAASMTGTIMCGSGMPNKTDCWWAPKPGFYTRMPQAGYP